MDKVTMDNAIIMYAIIMRIGTKIFVDPIDTFYHLVRIWRGHVLWPSNAILRHVLDRFQTVSKLSTRPLIDKRRTRNRSLPVACSRTVEQSTRAFVKRKSFFDSVFNRVECRVESDGWPRNGWPASVEEHEERRREEMQMYFDSSKWHERKVWNRSVEGIDICIYRIVKSSRTTTYCEEKENATGTIHTHKIRKISYEATRFLLSTRRAGEQELAGTPRTHARGTHDSSFSTLAIYGWRATWRDARRHGVIKVPLSMGNCNPQSLQPLQLLCHVVFSTRDFSLSISRP